MRVLVAAEADPAAPEILALHRGQRREHLGEAPFQPAALFGIAFWGVVDAAARAEQDAILRQQPEIEQQPARVPDLQMGLPVHRIPLRLGELAGNDDVGENRQQAAIERRMHPVAGIAVACDHHLACLDRSAGRGQQMAFALASPGRHRRSAMQDGAMALGCAGNAAGKFHRVQAKSLRMKQRAIGFAADEIVSFELRLAQQLRFQAEFPVEMCLAGRQARHAVGLVGQFQRAFRRAVDVDALAIENAPDRAHRFAALFEDTPGGIETPAPCPAVEILLADADRAKAAIAPAAAPTHAIGLQHMGANAVLARQMIGGREAGIPAADDGDIDIHVGRNRIAVLDLRAGGCGPV